MRLYQKTIVGGLVLAGLAGFFGCKDSSNEKSATKLPSHSVTIEQLAENEYRCFVGDIPPTFDPITGIYSFPEDKTGMSAEIHASARDKGKNAGITKMILYEDGMKIFSTEGDNVSFPINHDEPGKHTYQAEAIDNGGNSTKSQIVTVEFSGKLTDTPPRFSPLTGFYVTDGGDLHMYVSDAGDRKGLEEVLLYEDGNVIRKFKIDTDRFSTSIPLSSISQSGKHIYYAEAVDKGGNRSRSPTLKVNFE